jgi:chemotaxis protein histidine kinase CheA
MQPGCIENASGLHFKKMVQCTKNLLTNKLFSLIPSLKPTIRQWCNAALISDILEGATIMIKPSQFTQQMIDLQKTSFLNLYKAATTVQKQASSAMDLMLNQAPWIPSESRHVISDWLDTCQQESDRFKTYVEKSFANLGMYFSPKAAAKTDRAAKPSAAKAKKVSTAGPKKAAAAPAKKATPATTKKAAPVESKPAKVVPVKKTATVEPKTAVAEPAKKAAPAVTEKAAPVETQPAKTMPEKKADAPTKESQSVLK